MSGISALYQFLQTDPDVLKNPLLAKIVDPVVSFGRRSPGEHLEAGRTPFLLINFNPATNAALKDLSLMSSILATEGHITVHSNDQFIADNPDRQARVHESMLHVSIGLQSDGIMYWMRIYFNGQADIVSIDCKSETTSQRPKQETAKRIESFKQQIFLAMREEKGVFFDIIQAVNCLIQEWQVQMQFEHTFSALTYEAPTQLAPGLLSGTKHVPKPAPKPAPAAAPKKAVTKEATERELIEEYEKFYKQVLADKTNNLENVLGEFKGNLPDDLLILALSDNKKELLKAIESQILGIYAKIFANDPAKLKTAQSQASVQLEIWREQFGNSKFHF